MSIKIDGNVVSGGPDGIRINFTSSATEADVQKADLCRRYAENQLVIARAEVLTRLLREASEASWHDRVEALRVVEQIISAEKKRDR